ncbi:MAG: glutamine synthetase type III, partial [Bacteroidales bacterium]|nr:glutamine synthetase type III [Bacteroidales bacterium]
GTPIEIAGKKGKSVGIVEIPEIFIDNTDRNRTSPFAFTGNRFEFRAVGSPANCAGAMITLNAAVAQQLTEFKKAVDAELAKGKPTDIAVMDVLKPIIKEIIDVICFDGNGYTDAWKAEAARRGLDTEASVPEMFKQFTREESVRMFTETGVFTEKELEARNEVKWETYCKKIQIESSVMFRMAVNHIIPAAFTYKNLLLEEVERHKSIYGSADECSAELSLIRTITDSVAEVYRKANDLREDALAAEKIEDAYSRAVAFQEIALRFDDLRRPIDLLEEVVDNKIWPLPKYRELLFIS